MLATLLASLPSQTLQPPAPDDNAPEPSWHGARAVCVSQGSTAPRLDVVREQLTLHATRVGGVWLLGGSTQARPEVGVSQQRRKAVEGLRLGARREQIQERGFSRAAASDAQRREATARDLIICRSLSPTLSPERDAPS